MYLKFAPSNYVREIDTIIHEALNLVKKGYHFFEVK